MIRSRLYVCALVLFSFVLTLTSAAPSMAQQPPRGRVTDSSGAALARVPVRLVDRSGTTISTTITDGEGRFVFAQPCSACRVSASLPGFITVSADAASEATVVLAVAPVRESIVVAATRDEAPSSQVGAGVTVFDAAAIERRGDALVSDLLRQAPGVAVVQSGGRGTVTSLFVRGGENSYTKVLLDGIPINEPGGTFNFGGLTAGHFERIELVRGAQSAVFGSDAMAGVVQLVTHRGRLSSRPEFAAEISGGGYGSLRIGARVSGGTSRVTYSLHAGGYETDNRAPNNRFESKTLSATAGVTLSPSTRLRFVGRIEDGATGSPGQTAFGRPDLDAFFLQDHAVGGLSLEHQASRVNHRLTYALATSGQRSTNLVLDPPYTPSYQGRRASFEFFDFAYDSGSNFRRHHASYQGTLRIPHAGRLAGAEIFTLVADWDGERADLRDFLNLAATAPSRNNLGVSLQHQHVSERLAIATGVRFDDNASFGQAIVPRVSASWIVRRGTGTWGTTKLEASGGSGIKEPTLRQSFSVSPFDLGNPELEAEESRTIDAGIEQRLFNDRAKVELTWFDNEFRNQISTRTISFSPFQSQYMNVGRTEARGLEVLVEAVPVVGVRVLASHTFVASEIIARASEFSPVLAEGQWAIRRPRHSGQAQVLVDRGRVSADLGVAWIGRRNDSDFSSLEPALTFGEGYALWRGQLAVAVTSRTSAFVRVENLTDVEYMEPIGYPAWRRTVHGGLRITF